MRTEAARPKKSWIAFGVLAALLLAVWLLNASRLAPKPDGRPILIAQRGVAQVFDRKSVDETSCTARHIPPPTHGFIANTRPSIAAAFADGADVVELDLSATADGEFVAFHDAGLDCQTDGHGPLGDQSLAALKRLDVGYGFTADGGRTYPLRGKGVGLMPSLAEVLAAFPGRSFLIQLKQGPSDMAPRLVDYLDAHHADWTKLAFFGRDDRLAALRQLRPDARVWNEKAAARCTFDYLLQGWMGYVPASCRRSGTIAVSLAQAGLAWGWPNRFIQRMQANHISILVIGGLDSPKATGFWRVDSAQDLARLPANAPVQVWTDHVEVVGPLLRKRN